MGDYEAQLTPQYRADLPGHVARDSAEVGNITTGPNRDDEDIVESNAAQAVDLPTSPEWSSPCQSPTETAGNGSQALDWKTVPEDQDATEQQEEYDVKTLYEDDGPLVDFETFISNLPLFAFDLPRATSPAPPSLSSQDDGNGSSISTVSWDDARHPRYHAPSDVVGEAHDYSTGPLTASHMAPKAVRPNAPSDLRISTSQHGTLTMDTDGESFPPLPPLCTEAGSPDTAPGPSTPRTAFNYTPLKQQYALFPPLRIGEDRTWSPGHRVDTNGDQDSSQAKGKNKRSSTRSGFSSLKRRSSSLKRRSKASLMSLFSGSG